MYRCGNKPQIGDAVSIEVKIDGEHKMYRRKGKLDI